MPETLGVSIHLGTHCARAAFATTIAVIIPSAAVRPRVESMQSFPVKSARDAFGIASDRLETVETIGGRSAAQRKYKADRTSGNERLEFVEVCRKRRTALERQ